jgi:hypothetical protein
LRGPAAIDRQWRRGRARLCETHSSPRGSLLGARRTGRLETLTAEFRASGGTVVAVARQLAVDLWRWQPGQFMPQQFGLEQLTTIAHAID